MPAGPLPDRSDEIVGELPETFRPSHVDHLPNSLCWFKGAWVISADLWGDRRLARWEAGRDAWTEVAAPPGWLRRPMAAGSGLAALSHEHHADYGRELARRGGGWEPVADAVDEFSVTDWDGRRAARRDAAGNAAAWAAGGQPVAVAEIAGGTRAISGPGWELPLPAGATLSHLSPSPDRSSALAVVRGGGGQQAIVIALATGAVLSRGSLRHAVLPASAWLDETRVVLVAEEWPSLVPLVWEWSRGAVEPVWPSGATGTARSPAAAPDGICAAAVSTPLAPRAPARMDDTSVVGRDTGGVRVAVVERSGQRLPCLVHEPPGERRGTAFFVPGGPHVPIWAEYDPLAGALNLAGWRVVRVNVRSSGLRQAEFRPRAQVRYGIDDVADLCAVVEALGEGPVVTMGMSYGGYLAALAGERTERCAGIAVLGGFLHHGDLAGTGHSGVRQFARMAFGDRPALDGRLRRRYFIAHGSRDARIPMAAVLRHRGRMDQDATFVPLDGEGHAIRTDRAARLTYPALIRWMSELGERRPQTSRVGRPSHDGVPDDEEET